MIISNGTIKFPFLNYFVKIPYSLRGFYSLRSNVTSNIILASHTSFSALAPAIKDFYFFYTTEKLEMISFEDKKILDIFSLLLSNGIVKNIDLDKFVFKFDVQKKFISKNINFIKSMRVKHGLIHGDFHFNNILKNTIDQYFLIDLDYLKNDEIIYFDLINAELSSIVFLENLDFKRAFLSFYENFSIKFFTVHWGELSREEQKNLLFLYAVYRDKQENFFLTSHDWDNIIASIEKL